MGSKGQSSLLIFPISTPAVDITNLVVNSIAKASISAGSSTTYHIFQQAPSDGLPSGCAINDIVQLSSLGVWSLFSTYENYDFNSILVLNLLSSSGSVVCNQTYNKANLGWSSYLPSVIGLPTPTEDSTTINLDFNSLSFIQNSSSTFYTAYSLSLINQPSDISSTLTGSLVKLDNIRTINRVSQTLNIDDSIYNRTYKNLIWSPWKKSATTESLNSVFISKFINKSTAYGQLGLLDNNNTMYMSKSSDGFPGSYLGASSANVALPFVPVVFRKPDGSLETGKLIDSGVTSNLAYALFDTGNLYTWGTNAQSCLVVGDTTQRYLPTLSTTNVVKVWPPKNGTYDINYSSLFITKTDGFLYGGGSNENGELGITSTAQFSTWQKITYFPANSVLSVWNIKRCTIVQKTDLTIHFAGYNSYGQGATGTTENARSSFIDVTSGWGGLSEGVIMNVTGFTSYYDSGAGYQATILMHRRNSSNVDTVRSCGDNTCGQLGNGTIGGSISTSYKLGTTAFPSFPTSIKKLVVHGGSPMTVRVLSNSGDEIFWGWNGYAQGGNNTTTNNGTPGVVDTGIADIFGDGTGGHTWPYRVGSFSKSTTGQIKYRGYNGDSEGGLGNTTQTSIPTNVKFPAGVNIVDILIVNRAATLSTLYLDDTGQAWASGSNGLNGLDYTNSSNTFAVPRPLNIKLVGLKTQNSSGNMIGASSNLQGSGGLVPIPLAGQQNSFLKGDGSFNLAPFVDINNALTFTATNAGNAFKTINTGIPLGSSTVFLVNLSWSSEENVVAGWAGNAIGLLKPLQAINITNGIGGGYRVDISYMSHTNNNAAAGASSTLDIFRILATSSISTLQLSIYPKTYTLKLIPIYNLWFL